LQKAPELQKRYNGIGWCLWCSLLYEQLLVYLVSAGTYSLSDKLLSRRLTSWNASYGL